MCASEQLVGSFWHCICVALAVSNHLICCLHITRCTRRWHVHAMKQLSITGHIVRPDTEKPCLCWHGTGALQYLHRLCDLLQGETPQEMAGLAEAMQLKAVPVHTSCDGDSHFLLQQTCMQCLFHMLCFSILHALVQPALHDLMSQQACNRAAVC